MSHSQPQRLSLPLILPQRLSHPLILPQITKFWSQKLLANLNGEYEINMAKLCGEFVFSAHLDTDEFFYIVSGPWLWSCLRRTIVRVMVWKILWYVRPRTFDDKFCHQNMRMRCWCFRNLVEWCRCSKCSERDASLSYYEGRGRNCCYCGRKGGSS